MAAPTPAAQELRQSYIDQHIIFVCFITGLVILTYDYFLTLPAEIEYIWKRKLTLPGILFLTLRYFTFVGASVGISIVIPGVFKIVSYVLSSIRYSIRPEIEDPYRCGVLLRATNVINDLLVILIGSTMAFRIMALYNWKRSIILVLSSLLIGQTVLVFVFTAEVKFIFFEFSTVKACSIVGKFEFLSVVWWSPLAVDTILFALTIHRIYQLRKQSSQHSPLLHMLVRDGTLYYGVICITYAAILTNYYLNPNPSKGCGTIIGLALPVVVICRLILNLQELPSASTETEEQEGYYTRTSGAFTTYPSRLGFSLKNLKSTFFEERPGAFHYDLAVEV